MVDSLSGQTVQVEGIILETGDLTEAIQDWMSGAIVAGNQYLTNQDRIVNVPPGHRKGGVRSDVYRGYREGLDSACAHIVIVTRLLNGKPAVLVTLRARPPFGNVWWIQGGAIHSYRAITEFVTERAQRECGVAPELIGLVGVYRTCAEDALASTINICYFGFVEHSALIDVNADSDHTRWTLFTIEELNQVPKDQRHWYPFYVSEMVLNAFELVYSNSNLN